MDGPKLRQKHRTSSQPKAWLATLIGQIASKYQKKYLFLGYEPLCGPRIAIYSLIYRLFQIKRFPISHFLKKFSLKRKSYGDVLLPGNRLIEVNGNCFFSTRMASYYIHRQPTICNYNEDFIMKTTKF